MYKFLVWGVLVAASFASNDAKAEFRTLEGTASYRERIGLRPGAILEVELRDVSRADARAPLLASIAVRPTGQVPIPFRLLYDSALIDERMTYAVSAKLKLGDRVGTGLGLSISHDIIVKQHGGSIEVATQPGEFTEIKITLPRSGVLPTEPPAAHA